MFGETSAWYVLFFWQFDSYKVNLHATMAIDIEDNLFGSLGMSLRFLYIFFAGIGSSKSLSMSQFQGPFVTSQHFELNEQGQIVSCKFPNMCMDIKNASTSESATLILVRKIRTNLTTL